MRYSECIDTAIFYKSWSQVFERLTDEKAGQLIKAIYDFMNGGDPKLDDPILGAILEIMTKQIENSARKYIEKIEDYEVSE